MTAGLPNSLQDELVKAKAWLIEIALPFWSQAGFNRDQNLFSERLDFSGNPVDVPHRLMVQCRQIYVFSHATFLGWFDGREIAERALQTVLTNFATLDANAPFAFSVDSRGAIIDRTVDTYSYAFLLFALAWARRLPGVQVDEQIVRMLVSFLRSRLAHPSGQGFIDRLPRSDAFSRQNPQMHLFEALIQIVEVFDVAEARAICDELFALFESKLLMRGADVVPELHDDDWAVIDASNAPFEPGHHFEWIWLLDRYERMSGVSTASLRSRLTVRAVGEGIGKKGAVVETVNIYGQARLESRRCWATCEALKAASIAFRRGSDSGRAELDAASYLAAIRSCFLTGPFSGGWIDRIDGDGRPLVDHVPASTFYHLFLAIAEAAAVFNADQCIAAHELVTRYREHVTADDTD